MNPGRAYRKLALKHHPDKALQNCRWSRSLGACGATAAAAAVEAALKTAANEVFNYISTAHEELTNETSRRKVGGATAVAQWSVLYSAWVPPKLAASGCNSTPPAYSAPMSAGGVGVEHRIGWPVMHHSV